MMMIGRCSKGQHHIAVLVLAPDERTNEQNASFLRWEKNNVGVLALLIRVLVRTKERKVFVYLPGGKREETGFGKIFPLGKRRGLQRSLSLSLSSTLDDDGCAVASRHVTTRTTPRAAFFLLPLFSLSLSLFVFCFFHSPLHFCISSFGRLINRAHRCREIRFCVLLKIIASLLLLLLLLF